MRKLITLALFVVIFIGNASSQNTKLPQSKLVPEVSAEELIRQYSSTKSDSDRISLLSRVHAQGVSPTKTNITSLRNLLGGKLSDGERVIVVKIIGEMYTFDDFAGFNSAIERDIRSHIYSGAREVARAAIFSFSRMGYFEDSLSMLAYAREKKLIGIDEYFGEIAHALPNAPKYRQNELVSILATEDNPYGIEVVTMHIVHPVASSGLYPETLLSLEKLLARNEPNFPLALGQFGYNDAFRLTEWLHARAALHVRLGRGTYSGFVLSYLNAPKTDARKILAFLSSPEGGKMIAGVGRRQPFDAAMAKAKRYVESFPGHVTLRECLEMASVSMNTVK